MGDILNRVRAQLNFDPRAVGMRLRSHRVLEGGHTSLQFGRSDDFVDLREYTFGDDVRDIDWKASARNTHLVVRRYVAEKAQEFLLIADTGANLLAVAPSGESKRDLAILSLGAGVTGLLTLLGVGAVVLLVVAGVGLFAFALARSSKDRDQANLYPTRQSDPGVAPRALLVHARVAWWGAAACGVVTMSSSAFGTSCATVGTRATLRLSA